MSPASNFLSRVGRIVHDDVLRQDHHAHDVLELLDEEAAVVIEELQQVDAG